MSVSRVILAVGAIVVVAVLWLGVSLFGKVGDLAKKAGEVPETFTVGKDFIQHLSENDIDAASALAISELQTEDSRAALAKLTAENSDLLNGDTEVHFTGRGIDNDLRYAYGTISSGEISSAIYMEFLDENGQTRVSYFSFNEEDIPTYGDEN